MPRQVFDYDQPDRFVAGTVGEPGQRTFFLQARQGSRLTSVALEKEQVAVLAERIGAVLDEIVRRSGGTSSVPAATPADLVDNDPLDQPIEEEFRVGTMSLVWDEVEQVIVLEAHDRESDGDSDDSDDSDDGPVGSGEGSAQGSAQGSGEGSGPRPDSEDDDAEILRIRLTGGQARAFTDRALALVAAGRPPCPFCGQPLDPDGHVCPRQNGYRRR